eukprot:5376359-Lingulodinium_polyedra.AAC.1
MCIRDSLCRGQGLQRRGRCLANRHEGGGFGGARSRGRSPHHRPQQVLRGHTAPRGKAPGEAPQLPRG